MLKRRLPLALAACLVVPLPVGAQRFRVVETTITEAHRAMTAGRLTARQLTQHYLDRIAAYDQNGPAINALITTNPRALAVADSLDAVFKRTGKMVGPLHGIPVIVKDNYDTYDLPTTAGSLSLAGSIAPDDAYQVRRIREAGAIVIAKSNMAEFAFTPFETVGSMLPGYTRNPYALDRVTAGSSGGTAAAVAANLGLISLGTDTGNSIRGPSAHTALVGIRSTMGLTSRDGIIPLYSDRDVGGPMTRTVEDAVRVLDVIAGYDAADPVTTPAQERRAASYSAHSTFCGRFKPDINAYLASLGEKAPLKSLEEILRSRRFHPSIELRLRDFQAFTSIEEDNACRQAKANVPVLQAGVRKVMQAQRLDALIYPTWNNPPRRIGDLNTPHGNNSARISPPTGFPAFTVPMGWVDVTATVRSGRSGTELPVGLQILGDAWSEPVLIEIAYGYEQLTKHRRPPMLFPELNAR